MSITVAELETNLDKYLILAEKEDVYITKEGKIIAKLTNPYVNRQEEVESLFGIIPGKESVDDIKEERLQKI